MFFFFMGLYFANKNVFHGFGNFIIWLLKSFGNVFKGACMNPVTLSFMYLYVVVVKSTLLS